MNGAFKECSSLTSFPLINTSNVTNFGSNGGGAWQGCSSLTSFPEIDTSRVLVLAILQVVVLGVVALVLHLSHYLTQVVVLILVLLGKDVQVLHHFQQTHLTQI